MVIFKFFIGQLYPSILGAIFEDSTSKQKRPDIIRSFFQNMGI